MLVVCCPRILLSLPFAEQCVELHPHFSPTGPETKSPPLFDRLDCVHQCIHYFVPLNFLLPQCDSKESTQSGQKPAAVNFKSLTIEPPLALGSLRGPSSYKSSRRKTFLTDSVRTNQSTYRTDASESSDDLISSKTDLLSTPVSKPQPCVRTTYSHYKWSVLLRAKRQADDLRLKFCKERSSESCANCHVGQLLSAGARFAKHKYT
ncbi:unnamed protein product [Heterobilharzia americana]|nr:unnamed protein product [Heterobilharzia americana]